MITTALSQYNKGGDPEMQRWTAKQPDRIYQFSVEPEGIAAYLRVRGGQTKAGRGVYERRRPFVHMRFHGVDGALAVMNKEVDFVDGVGSRSSRGVRSRASGTRTAWARAGHHVHVRLARQALRLLRRQDGAAEHPRLQPPGAARQGAPAPPQPQADAAERAAHRPGQAAAQAQADAVHDHDRPEPVQQGRRPRDAALDRQAARPHLPVLGRARGHRRVPARARRPDQGGARRLRPAAARSSTCASAAWTAPSP